MEENWLKRKLIIEEAETENMVKDDRLGPEPITFGYQNKEWKKLLLVMKGGDELWEFDSPDETWEDFAGRKGISLLRNGKVIASIIILMN